MKFALPVVLLLLANVFMTFAWYGHLKVKSAPMFLIIVASWSIAFFEYCLQVPANRMGREVYSLAELKTIQEALTLFVFIFFSIFYMKEEMKWNYLVGFSLMVLAVFFVFYKR